MEILIRESPEAGCLLGARIIAGGSAPQLHPRTTVMPDENSAAGLHYTDHYRWVDAHKLDWQRTS